MDPPAHLQAPVSSLPSPVDHSGSEAGEGAVVAEAAGDLEAGEGVTAVEPAPRLPGGVSEGVSSSGVHGASRGVRGSGAPGAAGVGEGPGRGPGRGERGSGGGPSPVAAKSGGPDSIPGRGGGERVSKRGSTSEEFRRGSLGGSADPRGERQAPPLAQGTDPRGSPGGSGPPVEFNPVNPGTGLAGDGGAEGGPSDFRGPAPAGRGSGRLDPHPSGGVQPAAGSVASGGAETGPPGYWTPAPAGWGPVRPHPHLGGVQPVAGGWALSEAAAHEMSGSSGSGRSGVEWWLPAEQKLASPDAASTGEVAPLAAAAAAPAAQSLPPPRVAAGFAPEPVIPAPAAAAVPAPERVPERMRDRFLCPNTQARSTTLSRNSEQSLAQMWTGWNKMCSMHVILTITWMASEALPGISWWIWSHRHW